MPAGEEYYLYVVELDPSVPRRYAKCPQLDDPDAVSLYVGQSWYPPHIRFELHKEEERASRYARDYGVKLRPDLFGQPPSVKSKWLALLRERELAEELCRRGYVVFGGH